MKYYFSAIFSFAIWGTFALALKPLSDFNAFEILSHRVLFATVIIIVVCLLFKRTATMATVNIFKTQSKQENLKLIWNIIISATMLGLNWFSYIYVMNKVSVNATSLAYLICPILTMVLAAIFLKERLSRLQWFAVIISGISCIILSNGHFLDMIYSLFIALTYAIYLILQKGNQKIDKFITLALHMIIGSIILIPILSLFPQGASKPDYFYGYILIVATVYTVIPLLMNNFALKGLKSSIVGSLLYLNPIISFLLAVLYYNEPINMVQLIAFGMIFIAVILFNLANFQAKPAAIKET